MKYLERWKRTFARKVRVITAVRAIDYTAGKTHGITRPPRLHPLAVPFWGSFWQWKSPVDTANGVKLCLESKVRGGFVQMEREEAWRIANAAMRNARLVSYGYSLSFVPVLFFEGSAWTQEWLSMEDEKADS